MTGTVAVAAALAAAVGAGGQGGRLSSEQTAVADETATGPGRPAARAYMRLRGSVMGAQSRRRKHSRSDERSKIQPGRRRTGRIAGCDRGPRDQPNPSALCPFRLRSVPSAGVILSLRQARRSCEQLQQRQQLHREARTATEGGERREKTSGRGPACLPARRFLPPTTAAMHRLANGPLGDTAPHHRTTPPTSPTSPLRDSTALHTRTDSTRRTTILLVQMQLARPTRKKSRRPVSVPFARTPIRTTHPRAYP